MTSHRPLAISELANRVRPTGYDPAKSPKDQLRLATAERDAGEQAKSQGDLENAFIHFGKAATLMLEELPTHPKYNELSPAQKEAVVLHGQFILDSMTEIKPILFDRFSDWNARHPDADLSATTPPYQPSRRPKPLPELPGARREGRRAESTGNSRQQTSHTEPASPGSVLISNPYDQITKVTAHGRQGVGRQMQGGIVPSEEAKTFFQAAGSAGPSGPVTSQGAGPVAETTPNTTPISGTVVYIPSASKRCARCS
ncbi:hypothetical protein FRC08_002117 [Ceratobasidium sp. 394]|nr:hypothetical protein FRC08_002117 [Ceratobasidium sp. 394]